MEQFAIGANFKSAAARWDERERFDPFAEFKNFGRQTDGLRRVVSDDAIFDRDFSLHPASSFPTKMVRKSRDRVKMRAAPAFGRGDEARRALSPQARRLPPQFCSNDCEWKRALRRLLRHPVRRRRSSRRRQRTIP